ncbi:GNAT family protein [Catellatospora sp. NPDC049609]|uniref:GNAT family N-acetyltransferase n=1 Tax=Catellatospora sp. NPDC049609 TaxID=3155505 RepID=UPI00341287E6
MLSHPLTSDAELRALEPWRAPEFAEFIAAHRDHLAPWLPWAVRLTDVDATRAWLQAYAERQARDEGRIYGIWQHGVLVGGTLFRVFDHASGTAEIGVWLAPDAQGQGLITRAATHMIDWVVRERGMHRVEWRTVPTNAASIACAERLGMHLDGRLRECFPHGGVRHDALVYSLLAPEWTAR